MPRRVLARGPFKGATRSRNAPSELPAAAGVVHARRPRRQGGGTCCGSATDRRPRRRAGRRAAGGVAAAARPLTQAGEQGGYYVMAL
jgi:hypothetical protein